jgi:hypothetical protein
MIKKKMMASAGLLFLASTAVSFASFAPRTAVSGVRSVTRWGGCEQLPSQAWYCLGVVGTDFSTGSLLGAYFEGLRWSTSSFSTTYTLKKQTYTGTIYSDYTTVSYGSGAGSEDAWVEASQVKTNASVWDFLSADINSSVANAMTPIGILYTN